MIFVTYCRATKWWRWLIYRSENNIFTNFTIKSNIGFSLTPLPPLHQRWRGGDGNAMHCRAESSPLQLVGKGLGVGYKSTIILNNLIWNKIFFYLSKNIGTALGVLYTHLSEERERFIRFMSTWEKDRVKDHLIIYLWCNRYNYSWSII